MDLSKYYNLVENCIKSLGIEPVQCRGEKPGQWNLKKGSASVWIDVFKREEQEYGYFQCMAPVIQVPQNQKEELFEELLELNHALYGVAMTKYRDWVYIKTIREVNDLSEEEAYAMITRIGNYADEFDDKLRNKYYGPDDGGRPE